MIEDFIIKNAHKLYLYKKRGRGLGINYNVAAHDKCINHFSNNTNKCHCCGENNKLFLTLSHPNGDGWVHRKITNDNLYGHLIKNKFETKFELVVECYNCNMSRERNNGVCAHNG